MKVDKILQEAVKKQEKEILSKDEDFCDAFIKEHYKETSAKTEASNKKNIFKTRRFWMSFCSAFILVVCLSTFFGIWLTNDGEPTKHYSKENVQAVESTLENLNNILKFSNIKISNHYEVALKLYYDTISGDQLYYNLNISNIAEVEIAVLTVYVNKNYENDLTLQGETHNLILNNLILEFVYKCEVDVDEIFTHNVTANLITAFEEYRIDYSQMNFEEAYGFETFISNCILPK